MTSQKDIPTSIDYEALLQASLKSMMASVLSQVSKTGLPGDHHFYIGFSTQFPGVQISDRILKDYPEEMVIVLRYQFDGLAVTKQGFEVTLYFGGIAETLKIPFAAVKRFEDPSSDFSLKFTIEEFSKQDGILADLSPLEEELEEEGVSLLTKHAKVQKKTSSSKPKDGETPKEQEAAKVVSLDQFRKA